MSANPVNRPSDEAVIKATGADWDEWFKRLDKAGMHDKDHKAIVAQVKAEGCEKAWWQQTITVQYERARGLRDVHQRSTGEYQVARQRTMPLSDAELIAWVRDGRKRRSWTGLKLFTPKESILSGNPYFQFKMPDGRTTLHMVVEAKSEGKASLTVLQSDLAGPEECEIQKAFWTERIDTLKEKLGA